MGRVRPFEVEDFGQVAGLHARVFAAGSGRSEEAAGLYRSYFETIYLKNPWYDPALRSLVHQDDDGRIAGFLGVMPRPMRVGRRRAMAALTSQFIVEPERRATLAAVHLLKVLLSGPRDMTMADEAGPSSRKLREGLGGATELLYSLHRVRLLRPARLAITRRRAHRGPRSSLPGSTADRALRPVYDDRSPAWLPGVLAMMEGCGTFRKALVRNAARECLGWYFCYMNHGGIGEVLQLTGRDETIRDVIDHLVHEARREGVAALAGRLDPRFIPQLSERSCFFHHQGQWMPFHSRRPELARAVEGGDAFLTRLEGEWCMRLRGGYA